MAASPQTSFLGGRWSKQAQGRFEDPRYKLGMNESLNGLPVSEGMWSRRPGFAEASRTRDGGPGKLHSLAVNAAPSHVMEFTDGHLRLFNGARLLTDAGRQGVVSISAANPALVTVKTAHGWANDDRLVFNVDGVTTPTVIPGLAPLLQREFIMLVASETTFLLYSVDGHGIAGTDITFSSATTQLSVARITDMVTPYVFGSWKDTDFVQSDKDGFVLHGDYAPQQLVIADQATPFSLDEAQFKDGPYLDKIDGIVPTADRTTGVINLTFRYVPWDKDKAYSIGDFVGNKEGSKYGYRSLTDLNQGNNPSASPDDWEPVSTLNGFANNGAGLTREDIGRHVRLFSEPPDWSPKVLDDDDNVVETGDYAINQNVSFGDGNARTYYTAIAAITGEVDAAGKTNPNQPGFDIEKWIPNPAAARWTWGKICAPRPLKKKVPGHWVVPGFTLTLDCDRLHETPPNTASVAQCWYPNWYSPSDGEPGVDFAVPAADANAFAISQWPRDVNGDKIVLSGGGSVSWLLAQSWERIPGSLDAPTTPVFVDEELSDDELDGLPGKAFGDMTDNAGIDKLFQVGPATTFASKVGNVGYAGLRLDLPSVISSGRCYPVAQSDAAPLGFSVGGITQKVAVNMWANQFDAPANSHDGVLLGTTNVIGPLTSGAPVIVASKNLNKTWAYVWFEIVVTVAVGDIENGQEAFGGSFDYSGLQSYSVAASKMSFYADFTIPAGTYVGVQLKGDPLLYANTQIKTWYLGRYNRHEPTFPTTGCYGRGRLWLASGDNHGDASCSGDPLNFAPTTPDGVVTDGNAIAFDIASDSKNTILWMKDQDEGVLIGTSAHEWLVSAASGNVITNNNRKVEPVTSFGSAAVIPVATTLSTVFVHKNGRALQEMMRDAYSGQLVAPTLQEFAQDLTEGGVERLAYQSALTPIVWGYTGLGALIGTTYKRDNRISFQPPTFNGWHQHIHGNPGRKFISLATNLGLSGKLNTVTAITQDEAGFCRVEVLDDFMESTATIYASNFLDGAVVPHSGHYDSTTGVKLYGMWSLNNKLVSVFLGGLDCGEHYVDNGVITVPFSGFLTRRYLEQLAALGIDFGKLAVNIDGLQKVPCLVGYTYSSRGQRLRGIEPDETGINEVALGLKRRNDGVSILFHNTQDINLGTDFERLHPAIFTDDGGAALTPSELYSGVFVDNIEDDSTFDGMIAWESTGPYPANIAAISGSIVTSP